LEGVADAFAKCSRRLNEALEVLEDDRG